MWVVRVGDDLYVRSAARTRQRPGTAEPSPAATGRIRAGGVERDVTFADADPGVHDAIDAAYHAKYDRYGARIVATVVGPAAADVTIRLTPLTDRSSS